MANNMAMDQLKFLIILTRANRNAVVKVNLPSIPYTLSCVSTTAMGSSLAPILQVPTWWFSGAVYNLVRHLKNSSVGLGPPPGHSDP